MHPRSHVGQPSRSPSPASQVNRPSPFGASWNSGENGAADRPAGARCDRLDGTEIAGGRTLRELQAAHGGVAGPLSVFEPDDHRPPVAVEPELNIVRGETRALRCDLSGGELSGRGAPSDQNPRAVKLPAGVGAPGLISSTCCHANSAAPCVLTARRSVPRNSLWSGGETSSVGPGTEAAEIGRA